MSALPSTLAAIRALLSADPAVPPHVRGKVVDILRNDPDGGDSAPSNLLTISEVARRLATSTRTIGRWIERGELTAYGRGRCKRIDPAELVYRGGEQRRQVRDGRGRFS